MAENPVPVCAVADVPVNGVISREVGDELVAIYNIDGVFYATEARCTHGLADLADGTLDGDVIECSFHFGAFHVPSGKAVQPPQTLTLFPDNAGDFITYLGVSADAKVFGAKLSPYIVTAGRPVITAWTALMSMETGQPLMPTERQVWNGVLRRRPSWLLNSALVVFRWRAASDHVPSKNCLISAAVSAGFSSGKKCPPLTARPCTRGAHRRQMLIGPP